jgi:hypothetical protein
MVGSGSRPLPKPLKEFERLHNVTDISRRDVLRGGASMAAIAAAGAEWDLDAYAAGPHQPRHYVPYSRNSFFKSRVKGAPIDHDRTREFRRFMATYPDQRDVHHPRLNGLDGNDWGTVFAIGERHHPVWRLTGDVQDEVSRLRHRGFHAPAWLGRTLTGTSDSPFCVMDMVAGVTVFGTGARHAGRHTISVTSAAVTHHKSNGLDRRNPRSNNHRNFSSRGRISDAMVIRHSLVKRGMRHNTDLGHVLHLFLCETDTRAGFCNPMVGNESGNSGWGAEGERIAISRHVDLSKRKLSRAAMVIARTLQNYGCYIGDNSGSTSGLKAEMSRRPVWRGLLHADSLHGIHWNDFVVIKRGWQ